MAPINCKGSWEIWSSYEPKNNGIVEHLANLCHIPNQQESKHVWILREFVLLMRS